MRTLSIALLALLAVEASSFAFVPSSILKPSFSSSRLQGGVSPVLEVFEKVEETLAVQKVTAASFPDLQLQGYIDEKLKEGLGALESLVDPITLPTFSKGFDVKGVEVDLSIKEPTLAGLSTIKIHKPKVDLSEAKVEISLSFDKLELRSDDYDREAAYTISLPFGREKKIELNSFDRELVVSISDVTFGVSLDLDFTPEGGPVAKVKSTSDIFVDGKIENSLDTPDIITNTLKGFIAAAIPGVIDKPLSDLITDKLQALYESEKDLVLQLDEIYKARKAQGPDKDAEGNPVKPQVLKGFDGVGQVAFPTFWSVPHVPVDDIEHLTIEDVVARGKTGDLILMSGVVPGAYTIRRYTQSPFSHVTMIVKEPELLDGRPVLLQITSVPHLNLLTQKEIAGAQVNDIVVNHAEYKRDFYDPFPDDPVVCVYRSLNIERSEEEEKKWSANLVKFIKDRNEIPYAEGTNMKMLYIMGVIGLGLGESTGTDKDRSYYCASFIADAFMHYGLITEEFNHQQYSPRDFAEMYNNLPYISPDISHGPECAIDFV